MEQSIACEDNLVVAVLEEPADAVLGMARGVQALDGDTTQREAVAILGRVRYSLAVLAPVDLQVR